MKNYYLYIMFACVLFSGLSTQDAMAKKKKKTPALAAVLQKDSVNADYKKATQGGKTMQGLFNVIYKSKEGKLLFEMPDSAFQRTYMLSSRVAATSDTQDYVAGQMSTSPILICFTKDERNVYLHKMQYMDMVVEGDPMTPYQSETMKIRFHCYDTTNEGLQYWWQIDDVEITGAADATGITLTSTTRQSAPIYDLQGRRLSKKPSKGAYVSNGKIYLR